MVEVFAALHYCCRCREEGVGSSLRRSGWDSVIGDGGEER